MSKEMTEPTDTNQASEDELPNNESKPYCQAQIGGMECGNPVPRWGQQCATHDPHDDIKLPFSTDNGYFNGDMFEDWYQAEPSKEDERLWTYLHNWEENIRERVRDDLIKQFAAWSKEQSNE